MKIKFTVTVTSMSWLRKDCIQGGSGTVLSPDLLTIFKSHFNYDAFATPEHLILILQDNCIIFIIINKNSILIMSGLNSFHFCLSIFLFLINFQVDTNHKGYELVSLVTLSNFQLNQKKLSDFLLFLISQCSKNFPSTLR